jgi:type I restriction enzyme M protein
MKNIGNIIKTLQNIMRRDQGVSGDAQRIEQLGWMITLKIFDDKDKELEEIQDNYKSIFPKELKWRNWALDDEGLTGDKLKDFINNKLFSGIRNLNISTTDKKALRIRNIFEGTNNYMKNGTVIRQVLNELNQIDFNASEDRHLFGDIYETILRDLQSAGNYGEFYTPRAITEIMTEIIHPKLDEIVLDPACGTSGFLISSYKHILRNNTKKNLGDLITPDERNKLVENISGYDISPDMVRLSLVNLYLHNFSNPKIFVHIPLSFHYLTVAFPFLQIYRLCMPEALFWT